MARTPEEIRAYARRYYAEHREHICARHRRNRHNKPEEYRAKSRQQHANNREKYRHIEKKSSLRRFYGLTLEQYDALKEKQGGVCAICGRDGRLNVDHIHGTKTIRGLLCRGCNCGLGNFGDSVELMQRAIVYLKG